MKKILFTMLIIVFIIVIIFVINYKNLQMQKQEIKKFNSIYEDYNKDNLNGLDITTLINKAISNNEKYAIPKNSEGLYLLDEEYSIEIYVTMIINETTYRMERINDLGLNSFISYFGEVSFKCTDVKYHEKTGRISSMTFEAKEY